MCNEQNTNSASVPIVEQETVIQFNRVGDTARISTSDSTMKTKFSKLCEANPKHWKLVSDDDVYCSYECTPKSLISYRSKVAERELTDEQKQTMAERMRNLHAKKN